MATPNKIIKNLSEEDVKFFSEKTNFLKDSTDGIGMKKYESLCSKRQSANNFSIQNPNKKNPFALSNKEVEQIADFEAKKIIAPDCSQKQIDYWDKVYHPKNDFINEGLAPTKKLLYEAFKILFKNIYNVDFIENEDTIKNLGSVINYFCKNEDFFKSPTLIKTLDGKPLINNFKKGLLIIGDYGCGKSTIMEVMAKVIEHYYSESYSGLWKTHNLWRNIRFRYSACWQLVTEFEGLQTPDDRVLFTDKYTSSKCYFDDLTKESPASNYGVKNLMKNFLEIRYDKRIITHATMNYSQSSPNDITSAVNQIGENYGGHNYDRTKEMFNILEFKGKSFRK